MPPIKDNKIDENEARLIGSFLVTIGEEIGSANRELRSDSIKNAEEKGILDHYYVDDAEAEYRMSLEIGKGQDGAGKKRQSEVLMRARYKRASSNLELAPFNLLYGIISPAERKREEIISHCKETDYEDVKTKVTQDSPILSLGKNRFLLVLSEGKEFYVVECLPNVFNLFKIKNLEEFTKECNSMFLFMQEQLSKIYRS